MFKDIDELPMMAVYVTGMAALMLAGIGSAAIQGGVRSFIPFFLVNFGGMTFFACLIVIRQFLNCSITRPRPRGRVEMTKDNAVKVAVVEVLAGRTMMVIRHGSDYSVRSGVANVPRGWRVAEMIGPGNVQNYTPLTAA